MRGRHPFTALALLAVLALTAAAVPGQGPSAQAVTATTVQPNLPNDFELWEAWPAQARELGIGGVVDLYCVWDTGPRPRECQVISERPAGLGFGRAVLSLTSIMTMPAVKGPDGKAISISRRPKITFACAARCKAFPTWDLTLTWSEAPTGEDVRNAYPPVALTAGQGGIVVLACQFNEAGHPAGCRADSERPAGEGFGAAAITLAPKFRALGKLTGIPIRIPVRFQAKDGQAVTSAPAARRAPTIFDILGATPATATGPGQATLACRIGREGKFDVCAPRVEQPEGQGFGQAALGLSDKYSFNIWNPNGLPVIGAVLAAPFQFPDPKTPRPSIIASPDWVQTPSAAKFASVYPDRAMRLGMEGQAVILCTVQADGRLASCTVDEESPANMGFGEAALSMADQFAMRPQTRDGAPVGGARVNIPVQFKLE